ARVGDPHDGALEGRVGGDEVGAAAEHQQLLAALVGRGDGGHQLLRGADLDERADAAADAQGGEVGQARGAHADGSLSWTVARARPSTAVPSTLAWRSSCTVRAAASTFATLARTSRVT